jgi:hypothetical protein
MCGLTAVGSSTGVAMFTIASDEVISYLRPQKRLHPLTGMISLYYEADLGAQKVLQNKLISPDLVPTRDFLHMLNEVAPNNEGKIYLTWHIARGMVFTLRFDRDKLIANGETRRAAVKTEYAELFAHYDGRSSDVLLDSQKAEFIVFRKHLNKLPVGLYQAATEVSEPWSVVTPIV